MPHSLQRISIHGLIYIVLLLGLYGIISQQWIHLSFAIGSIIVTCFAAIQGIFELVLHRFHSADSKTKLFRIMALRSAKFLSYLIIALVFLMQHLHEQMAVSLLVIALFTIYTIFDLVLIIKRS